VCCNPKGDILISTRGSEIIEIKQSNMKKGNVLMRGHFDKELWGLTVHPDQNTFFTVGEEGLLAHWDTQTRT
jgi:WD40 repeat protein